MPISISINDDHSSITMPNNPYPELPEEPLQLLTTREKVSGLAWMIGVGAVLGGMVSSSPVISSAMLATGAATITSLILCGPDCLPPTKSEDLTI